MNPPDVNADLTKRVVVRTSQIDWQPSPSGTVWRKPLYREGGEFGPVTSVVRYDAGGKFDTHFHPQGEEILVLSGVFSDENGDYPTGTYILNPDGTSHAPHSVPGCELLVRLRQYDGDGRVQVALDTESLEWETSDHEGVARRALYQQEGIPESMLLELWESDQPSETITYPHGGEIFVLEGGFADEVGEYAAGDWIRMPPGSAHRISVESDCVVYKRLLA